MCARLGDPLVQAIPVVAVSASRDVAASVSALGVQEILTKPNDLDHILVLVQQ